MSILLFPNKYPYDSKVIDSSALTTSPGYPDRATRQRKTLGPETKPDIYPFTVLYSNVYLCKAQTDTSSIERTVVINTPRVNPATSLLASVFRVSAFSIRRIQCYPCSISIPLSVCLCLSLSVSLVWLFSCSFCCSVALPIHACVVCVRIYMPTEYTTVYYTTDRQL